MTWTPQDHFKFTALLSIHQGLRDKCLGDKTWSGRRNYCHDKCWVPSQRAHKWTAIEGGCADELVQVNYEKLTNEDAIPHLRGATRVQGIISCWAFSARSHLFAAHINAPRRSWDDAQVGPRRAVPGLFSRPIPFCATPAQRNPNLMQRMRIRPDFRKVNLIPC